MFQSTPPRGGRLVRRNPQPRHVDVSIHAPARGATPDDLREIAHDAVSIHAPARGATMVGLIALPPPLCFNPRPRAGGDGPMTELAPFVIRFNPRPRAGGDTRNADGSRPRRPVSIHAPARGATLATQMGVDLAGLFQSTPPRGGRPRASAIRRSRRSFNPRPRAGGDHSSQTSMHTPTRFQSTPPRGGRRGRSLYR